MANPKLFVSLPMRGYDETDIQAEMLKLQKFVEITFGQEYELINTINNEEPPNDILHNNFYLGKSIQKLASADLCIFHPDWKSAAGCIIEHMVCAMYDIPYVEMQHNTIDDPDETENLKASEQDA